MENCSYSAFEKTRTKNNIFSSLAESGDFLADTAWFFSKFTSLLQRNKEMDLRIMSGCNHDTILAGIAVYYST